ncbi:MAG: elongation factor P [Candidatus Latescibacteria bacterium]|nr:elongation factor P [Candidatus Latescibacterota bacterium]
MATTKDFRNGFTFDLDGATMTIVEFQHVKPGKGGAFVRTKLRNVETGSILERTFDSGTKLEEVRVERRQMEYLYNTGDIYYFMDQNTYEQSAVNQALVTDIIGLMRENEICTVVVGKGRALSVELPAHVELKVVQTDPGVRGDTAQGGTKPATLESGATVMVPLFLEEGTTVRVDTRTGDYMERVN